MLANWNFRWIFAVCFALLAQVLFLRELNIAGLGFCFIYLWFLIKAPLQISQSLLLLGSFVIGWVVDIFYNTHGMHAFACVLIAMARPTVLRILTPANGYDERSSISLAEMKWLWFFSYVFLMLLTHHLVLFILEASDWNLLGLSIARAFCSTLVGMLVFGMLEFFNRPQ